MRQSSLSSVSKELDRPGRAAVRGMLDEAGLDVLGWRVGEPSHEGDVVGVGGVYPKVVDELDGARRALELWKRPHLHPADAGIGRAEDSSVVADIDGVGGVRELEVGDAEGRQREQRERCAGVVRDGQVGFCTERAELDYDGDAQLGGARGLQPAWSQLHYA